MESILSLALLGYSGGFREGDWVNYSDFRFINCAAQDQTTVYFGTSNGVIRYDKFGNDWLDPITVTDGLPDPRINNIAYESDNDRLWVTTPLGNAYYQPTFQRWYLGLDFPTELARNDYKPLSLGMLNTDFGYTYQNGVLTDLNFRSFQLTRGIDDGFNHLYVGTWGLGAVIINPRYGQLQRIPYGPYSEDASTFVRVGNKFWMGSSLGDAVEPGITRCDTSLQIWNWYVPPYTRGMTSTNLSCAIGDGPQTWLGTDNGLMRYDSVYNEFYSYSNSRLLPSLAVTSLAEDSAWVYVGTDNGLGYISRYQEEKGNKHKKVEQAAPDTVSSAPDSAANTLPLMGKNRLLGWYIYRLKVLNDYLYAGTNRGVLRRQLGNYGDFSVVNTSDSLLSTDIIDIAQVRDSLYFATRNDIIIIDTKTGLSSSLTQLTHFGQWQIRQIAVGKQRVWAATDAGLWMYRLSDGYERLFTVSDGMISADVRSLELIGNYIWMATPKGVIRFLWNRPGRSD